MQKQVNHVDPVKSFPTNIFLQNLASIQKRTSPIKFDHLADKSEKASISNLSTEVSSTEADGLNASILEMEATEQREAAELRDVQLAVSIDIRPIFFADLQVNTH